MLRIFLFFYLTYYLNFLAIISYRPFSVFRIDIFYFHLPMGSKRAGAHYCVRAMIRTNDIIKSFHQPYLSYKSWMNEYTTQNSPRVLYEHEYFNKFQQITSEHESYIRRSTFQKFNHLKLFSYFFLPSVENSFKFNIIFFIATFTNHYVFIWILFREVTNEVSTMIIKFN